MTTLPESFTLESILAKRCVHHQEEPWVRPNIDQARWLARNNQEINPITIKPETLSHIAEQFSRVSLPYCSPLPHPFPIKSFDLSVHVSPWTVHFRVLDKSPLSDSGKDPHSCKISRFWSLTCLLPCLKLYN